MAGCTGDPETQPEAAGAGRNESRGPERSLPARREMQEKKNQLRRSTQGSRSSSSACWAAAACALHEDRRRAAPGCWRLRGMSSAA